MLPPFSCYLVSDERRTYFKLEESADGMEILAPYVNDGTPNSKWANGSWYDLYGRKVADGQQATDEGQLKTGLYIRDGKKVLISK